MGDARISSSESQQSGGTLDFEDVDWTIVVSLKFSNGVAMNVRQSRSFRSVRHRCFDHLSVDQFRFWRENDMLLSFDAADDFNLKVIL